MRNILTTIGTALLLLSCTITPAPAPVNAGEFAPGQAVHSDTYGLLVCPDGMIWNDNLTDCISD